MKEYVSAEPAGTPVPEQVRATASAVAVLRRACPRDAHAALDTLLAGHAEALRQQALLLIQRKDPAAAAAALAEALALRPDAAVLHDDMGDALRGLGQLDHAIASYRRATELAPATGLFWYHLGRALRQHAFDAQARDAFERALACDPGHIEARGALGDALNSLGDTAAAAACFRLCARERAHAPRAWSRIANLKTVKMTTDDLHALRALAADPTLGDNERIFVGYALAKALEDQADYPSSFAVLSAASALKRRQVTWDAARFSAWIDAIAAAFARPLAGAGDPRFGQEVVFVVGMPRSGSTLTEEILAAHPQVEGASELTDLHAVLNEESARRDLEFPHWVPMASAEDWHRLGANYLQRTQRWRQHHARFTDKGLDNWPLVGAAVAMLPGARFVNCRRDPVETCLSCYRQLFHFGSHASYDLGELAANWRDYDRLSRTWRERFPDRVFDTVYEDLLDDPEAQVHRLLTFLDLPFDPACLEFHRSQRAVRTFSSAQVRQPLNRNTARAHLYGSLLDPLRNALGVAPIGRVP